jgi:hypothetical protein
MALSDPFAPGAEKIIHKAILGYVALAVLITIAHSVVR